MNNNKPITLIREEFITNIVDLCNTYRNFGLPFFAMEDILKNLIQEIHSANLQQVEEDKKYYNQLNAKQDDE
jgi:hypothetical protein